MVTTATRKTRYAGPLKLYRLKPGVQPPWIHTRRELEIMWWITTGANDQEIANQLGLRRSSVVTRCHMLRQRSGCHSRAALVAVWFRWHIAHGSTHATQRPTDFADHLAR